MDVERDTTKGLQSAAEEQSERLYEHEGPNPIIAVALCVLLLLLALVAAVLLAVVAFGLADGAIYAWRWLTTADAVGGGR